MRIDAINIGENPPDDVNVIIEVSHGGQPIKYELDKDAGTLVVDRFLNPVRWKLSRDDERYLTGLNIIWNAAYRSEYEAFLNDILYNSVDSYAQLRLYYLQRRAAELGQEDPDDFDPYEDILE